jgi:hypothetical protein
MANTIEEFAQLETLWDKAIQSPAEISLEEKHQPVGMAAPCGDAGQYPKIPQAISRRFNS